MESGCGSAAGHFGGHGDGTLGGLKRSGREPVLTQGLRAWALLSLSVRIIIGLLGSGQMVSKLLEV